MLLLARRLPALPSPTSALRIHVRHINASSDAFVNSSIPANKQRFIPTSGRYPKGFVAGSIDAGINPNYRDRPDLVMVASEVPANGAAVFTRSQVPSSSVIVSRELLKRTEGHGLRGVIANSGCANVWTGQAGLDDSTAMMMAADKYIAGSEAGTESSTIVMHTGSGGMRLPLPKITNIIPKLHASLGSSHFHWYSAAQGILTTDKFPKMLSRTFTLPSPSHDKTTYTITGITKGAGMIHPNMATTLGIICTDAPVTARALQQALRIAADKSYNCISIEGDTSTNDMVAMLANGAACPSPSTPSVDFDPTLAKQSDDFIALQKQLIGFSSSLAKLVVRDGEGATKFVGIRVRHAPSYAIARRVASRIARSVLFKAALYGSQVDSWGNVLAALGSAVLDLPDPGGEEEVLVSRMTSVGLVMNLRPAEEEYFNNGAEGSKEEEVVWFYRKGEVVQDGVDADAVKRVMQHEDVEFIVDLRDDKGSVGEKGEEEAVYWTCDISHEFVTINGDFPH